MFSIEGTPRERRNHAPRWRLASCLSGLLHDIGKPLSDVSVTNQAGSLAWNPYAESLHAWAMRHHIERYFIRWRDKRHKRHEPFSLLTIERIITTEVLQYLSVSGPEIIEALLEAIAGTSVNQPVTKLMLRADQESVSRDLRQSRLNVDEFAYGVPVERYVFDAIRRLIKTGKWKVNTPGAKVWHLLQGVFIVWKPLDELYDLINQDKIPGIPRDPDTLADILIERGFAVPNRVKEKEEEAYYRYWEVCPQPLQKSENDKPVKLLMLQFQSPELVFTTEPPATVAGEVIRESEQSEQKGSAETGASAEPLSEQEGTSSPAIRTQPTAEHSQEDSTNFPFDAFGIDSHSETHLESDSTDDASTSIPLVGNITKDEPEQEALPDVQADLRALIATYGEAAPLLETALCSILEGKTALSKAFSTIEGQVVIPYPEGAKLLGAPLEVMATLHRAKAIIPDPVTPSRKVRDFDGVKALALAKPLSKAVMAAISRAQQSNQQHEPSTPLKASHQEDENKPSPEPAPEPSKQVQQDTVHSEPSTERQNLARLPRRVEIAKPVVLEKPIVEPTSVMEEKISDESLPQEKVKSRQNQAAQAIEMLKEMIQQGSGRWLASTVIEQDGFLVTSDKALDSIAGEGRISKHLLVGILRSGQHHPLLQIREGKLYLPKKDK